MVSASDASKKINVGFIGLSGAGWAANTLAPAVTQPSLKDTYDLIAVSTTSETSAQASAEKYSKELGHPVKAYFGDTSKISNDPDVNLVIVSVKAPQHKQAVLPVIEAKKDFFIEWPVGASIEETEEIAAAARKQGVRTIVGLQGRHSYVSIKVKELLSSGVIGTVRSTSVFAHVPREQHFWAPSSTERNLYVTKYKNGTTPLIIPIGHQLDTLTNILGDFVEVTATAATLHPIVTIVDDKGIPTDKTYPSEIHDHYSIAGRLQNDVLANIFWRIGYSYTEGRRQFIWEIEGDEGVIRVESNHELGALPGMVEPDLYLNGKKIDIGDHGGPIEAVGVALKAFAENSTRPESYATIEHAIKHKRLLNAIEESARNGKKVIL